MAQALSFVLCFTWIVSEFSQKPWEAEITYTLLKMGKPSHKEVKLFFKFTQPGSGWDQIQNPI